MGDGPIKHAIYKTQELKDGPTQLRATSPLHGSKELLARDDSGESRGVLGKSSLEWFKEVASRIIRTTFRTLNWFLSARRCMREVEMRCNNGIGYPCQACPFRY